MSRIFARCVGFNSLFLVTFFLELLILVLGDEEAKLQSQYDQFKAKYKRSEKDSFLDLPKRLAYFFERTARIFEHNMLFLKKEVSYHLERNQFADMSYEDLSKITLKAEDLGQYDEAGADIDRTKMKEVDGVMERFLENSNPKRRGILDFRKDAKMDESLVQFLDLLKTKMGDAIVNEVVKLKEALNLNHDNSMNRNHGEPFNPVEAIKSNFNKMRAPFVSFMESAKGAFWEYLKDEGLVIDIERKVLERAAEVKRIRMRIDWRITKCLAEPREQSLCNSCYAISVISLIEYYYCRQMGQLRRFSPQYIVDCGQSSGLRGCEGGKLTIVGQFIQKNGLQMESDFPYTGIEGQCSLGMGKGVEKVWPHFRYWTYIHENKTADDWLQHATKGPLLVGIGMPADFFAYGGGIHDGQNCDPNMVHAMLLVGFGVQDDKEFWLLQNSFSKDWGENGYFRLLKDAPKECFNAVITARPGFSMFKD